MSEENKQLLLDYIAAVNRVTIAYLAAVVAERFDAATTEREVLRREAANALSLLRKLRPTVTNAEVLVDMSAVEKTLEEMTMNATTTTDEPKPGMGRFWVPYETLARFDDYMAAIEGSIKIVDEKRLDDCGCMEYTAVSELFDSEERGNDTDEIKLYRVLVNSDMVFEGVAPYEVSEHVQKLLSK